MGRRTGEFVGQGDEEAVSRLRKRMSIGRGGRAEEGMASLRNEGLSFRPT